MAELQHIWGETEEGYKARLAHGARRTANSVQAITGCSDEAAEVFAREVVDLATDVAQEIKREMKGEAWKPIETAPKDVFLLLLYNEQEGVCAGYWDICEEPPTWVQVETQGVTSAYMRPTHWMPLPDPPESK